MFYKTQNAEAILCEFPLQFNDLDKEYLLAIQNDIDALQHAKIRILNNAINLSHPFASYYNDVEQVYHEFGTCKFCGRSIRDEICVVEILVK